MSVSSRPASGEDHTVFASPPAPSFSEHVQYKYSTRTQAQNDWSRIRYIGTEDQGFIDGRQANTTWDPNDWFHPHQPPRFQPNRKAFSTWDYKPQTPHHRSHSSLPDHREARTSNLLDGYCINPHLSVTKHNFSPRILLEAMRPSSLPPSASWCSSPSPFPLRTSCSGPSQRPSSC